MIVRVGGEGKVRQHCAQMQHGGELNSEFARGMHRDAELEGLANRRRFDAGRMPPQNVVSSSITSTAVSRMLAASCSKFTTTVLVASGIAHHLPRPAHAVQAEDRILEIIVAHALDGLAETDGLLGRPCARSDRSGTNPPGKAAASARYTSSS